MRVFDTDGILIEQWHLYRSSCVSIAGNLLFVGEHCPHRVQRFGPDLGCVIRILDLGGRETGNVGAGTYTTPTTSSWTFRASPGLRGDVHIA